MPFCAACNETGSVSSVKSELSEQTYLFLLSKFPSVFLIKVRLHCCDREGNQLIDMKSISFRLLLRKKIGHDCQKKFVRKTFMEDLKLGASQDE